MVRSEKKEKTMQRNTKVTDTRDQSLTAHQSSAIPEHLLQARVR